MVRSRRPQSKLPGRPRLPGGPEIDFIYDGGENEILTWRWSFAGNQLP